MAWSGFLSGYMQPGQTTTVQNPSGTPLTLVGTGARLPVEYGGTMGSGGAAATPKTENRNWRADAAALYPWLTPALLDVFAEKWDETGDPTLALAYTRQHPEYKTVFDGIYRDDGTLRMTESEYFSTKAGFTEAMVEFGIDPSGYESKYGDLFRNDVSASEFYRTVESGYQRFNEPGAADNGLLNRYLDEFVGSGSAELALNKVRQSSDYDKVFVGNRREDGTLRMEEQDFFAYKRGWQRTLAGFGLDPLEFEARGRFKASVTGELSIQEVGQRLQSTQDGILDQIEPYKQYMAENYGLDLTNEAILGMAIDPGIQKDVLERRINASQVGGEAALQGFRRNVERAEELARAGLSGDTARQLYSGAAQNLSGLSATTQRFNRGATGIGDYEQAFALSDAGQQNRITRGLQDEQSNFGGRSDTRRSQDGFGLRGLRSR